MADSNGGSLLQGLVADIRSGNLTLPTIVITFIIASAVTLPLLSKVLTPNIDSREPPVIKPSIPFIGHIIGIIRYQSHYHRIIHNANPSRPIATLPMLNGKMYSIYDPNLIQTALRSKTVSLTPFATDFAQKTFGLDDELTAKVKADGVFSTFVEVMHASFAAGMVQKMNVHFLANISAKMDPISCGAVRVNEVNAGKEEVIPEGLEVENLYLWIRDVMTLGTTKALYGDHDPFGPNPSLVDEIWAFEEAIPYFLLSLLPSITMPKAFKARAKLQTLLSEYYAAEHDINDPTTSQLVLNRANTLRKYGFTGSEIGKLEVILPNVATLNAVPTLYWLLLYVLVRPELMERVRKEVEAATLIAETDDGKRTVTFDIADFDTKIPLLVSCYRETMRLSNHSVSMRRVMEDLTITSPNGQSYLLQKGIDIQLPAGVTHRDKTVWGQDANEFDPERFLPPGSKDKTTESVDIDRRRRATYIPFGGGRHLCPGRNFAIAEILGFTSVLLLGFEIEPVGMRFDDMKMLPPTLATGAVRPEKYGKGLGGRMVRRKGWENVEWKFEC
ncbi:cytochrome P450 [Thelonectria olida]|uniref:Cytochrome P450 n=1 Tax=Thelonectria olida TaxID=1576542 RepID=A0A9P9AM57_9HYPO|nr:cytochrome P450 [Thelonectria olida]